MHFTASTLASNFASNLSLACLKTARDEGDSPAAAAHRQLAAEAQMALMALDLRHEGIDSFVRESVRAVAAEARAAAAAAREAVLTWKGIDPATGETPAAEARRKAQDASRAVARWAVLADLVGDEAGACEAREASHDAHSASWDS